MKVFSPHKPQGLIRYVWIVKCRAGYHTGSYLNNIGWGKKEEARPFTSERGAELAARAAARGNFRVDKWEIIPCVITEVVTTS